MKILIVGLGSIGRRHTKNLQHLGYKDIYALRSNKSKTKYSEELNVKSIYSLNEVNDICPTVAIITNPTNLHVETSTAIIKNCPSLRSIFIEKPLSGKMDKIPELKLLVDKNEIVTFMGYDMRFDPIILKSKKIIDENRIGKLISARLEVGHYLPDWHSYEDYRQSYAARAELGGGPILTLIHEIDYMYYLFGNANSVFCMKDKQTSLEIDTEDTAEILYKLTNGMIVSIHLDFVKRKISRTNEIIGERGILKSDFINRTIRCFLAGNQKYSDIAFQDYNYGNQVYVQELITFFEYHENRVLSHEYNLDAGIYGLQLALKAIESAEKGEIIKIGGAHENKFI